MLRFAISLRIVMIIASFGAGLGAILMFWEGGMKMVGAAQSLASGDDSKMVITSIMRGTDAFLFGIVLVIFAYAIAFGFVFDLSLEGREKLPSWMRVNTVSELKDTLVAVILVYLLVDFVTDWPGTETELSWQMLAKPLSILALAAAFRLLAASHAEGGTTGDR
jgi:uncharacterized membrane protein YqhA